MSKNRSYDYNELFVTECLNHGLHWNHKTWNISEACIEYV